MIEGKIRSTTKVGLDKSSPYKHSICHIYYGFSAIHLNLWLFSNTNAIIPVSPRGAKKIPSLCSEQAVRSAVASAAWQSHPIKTRLPRSLRSLAMTIYCMRLPRPFRARNGHNTHKVELCIFIFKVTIPIEIAYFMFFC